MTFKTNAPTLSDICPELSGFSAKDFNKNQVKVNISASKFIYALLLILGIGSILLVGIGYLCRQPNAHLNHHHHHRHRQIVNESYQKVKNSSLGLVTSKQQQVPIVQNLTVYYGNEFQTLLESELRLKFIRKMTLNVWEAHFGSTNVLNTNDDGPDALLWSMSTLWVLGLKKQFNRAKEWILEKIDLTHMNESFVVSRLVSDYIGGLLSCYALTGDSVFLDRAFRAGEVIHPAYKTPLGDSYGVLNPAARYTEADIVSITKVGKQLLVYACLENMDPSMANKRWIQPRISSINHFFNLPEANLPPFEFLRMYPVNVCTGKPFKSSILWYRTSKYMDATRLLINLAKLYIESGSSNRQNITIPDRWYKNASNSVAELVEDDGGDYATRCSLGAILYLRWKLIINQTVGGFTSDLHVEKQLSFELIKSCDEDSLRRMVKAELAESYLILWRLTHDQKYRDYAWAMAQEIAQLYGTSHLLSDTLKYLYLTFTDDSVLPLGEWVFNSAGHPLPICGTNDAYPEGKCSKTQ